MYVIGDCVPYGSAVILWSWIGDLTMCLWPYAVCGWCVVSVCRQLELTVWVMWRPCR